MRRTTRLVNGWVGVGERSPRVLQQRDPGRCELHVPGGPHEEHHSFRSSTGGSTDADTDRAERRAPAKQRGRHFAFTAW
jgi:hypothetical protein